MAVFLIAWAIACIPASAAEPVDLGNWNPRLEDSIGLNDGWTVYRNALVSPREFAQGCAVPSRGGGEDAAMPDVWGPAFTRHVKTGHGVSTYCADLLLPKGAPELSVYFSGLRSVFSIYAVVPVPGAAPTIQPLANNGNPATAATDVPTNTLAQLAQLPRDAHRVVLVVQIANYIHKQGGITSAPEIGIHSILRAESRRNPAMASALVALLVFLATATVILGWSNGHRKATGLFAALCLATAFRELMVSDLIWEFLPELPEYAKYNIEYLTGYLIAPAYFAYVSYLLDRGTRHWVDLIVYAGGAAFAVFSIVAFAFPPGTITLFREAFFFLCAFASLHVAVEVSMALRYRRKQSAEAASVALAMVVIVAYELMSSLEIIQADLSWSNAVILVVTIMMGRAYVLNYKKIEAERNKLNTTLKAANATLEARAQSLHAAALRAEEASRAKSEFVAMMSHELRTPLNAVIGLSEIMERGLMGPLGNERYKEYAGDIQRSGQHLLSLVNDILDISQIESGSDVLREDWLDMVDIIETVFRLVRQQAEQRAIKLVIKAEPGLPELYGDRRKIKQILTNLVSNAIKFNRQGGTVTVRAWTKADMFVLEVEDTGIGMSQEDLPKAMAKFGQVESNHSRKYDGIGLGLPIVKALVEQHGGEFFITSMKGAGTTVGARFPASRWRDAARERLAVGDCIDDDLVETNEERAAS